MPEIKTYIDKKGNTRYKFNAYLGRDERTGKDRRTTRQGFKTKKEARLVLRNLETKASKGMLNNPTIKIILRLKKYIESGLQAM